MVAEREPDLTDVDLLGNGRIEMLPVGVLTVDKYQRQVKQFARRVAKDFVPLAAAVLIVSRRADGTLVLLDGLQRKTAMQEKFGDLHRAMCLVYEGLTYAQEAALFVLLNTKESMSADDMFHAELEARIPWALLARQIVADSGIELTDGTGHKRTDGGLVIRGTGWLRTIARPKRTNRTSEQIKNWPTYLRLACALAAESWTDAIISPTVMHGLVIFVRRYEGKYDSKRLKVVLSAKSPEAWRMASYGVGVPNKSEAVRVAIVRDYNHRLHASRRLMEGV